MAQPGMPQPVTTGAAAPLPAIGMNPPPPVTTFADLFQTMPDVYDGDYTDLLLPYAPDQNLTQEQVLHNTLYTFPLEDVPAVFVYQTNEGKLETLALPHRARVPNNMPEKPWHRGLAFSSDVMYGQVGAVTLLSDLFTITAPVTVPLLDSMADEWGLEEEEDYLGPYTVGAKGAEAITTRGMIVVPHAYVSQLWGRSLSPEEAWLQVGEKIREDGRTAQCKYLLNFLRVASCFRLPVDKKSDARLPETVRPRPLAMPRPDPQFMEHVYRQLQRHLPGLSQVTNPTAMTHQLMQSTTELREVMQLTAAAQAVRGTEEPAQKTFSELYVGVAPSIRKLCGAGDDDAQLPPFWKMLAQVKGKKNQALPQLNAFLAQRAREPDSAQVFPIFPASLYEQVSAFSLGSLDLENITTGLTPFLMCPRGYSKAKGQEDINTQYIMMHGEGGAATLEDIRKLVTATYNVPDNLYQLLDFIGAYSVIIDVFIGKDEPLSRALYRHYVFWRQNLPQVISAIPNLPANHTRVCIGVLRSIQLTTMQYINNRLDINLPDDGLPSYSFIEEAVLRRSLDILPGLPDCYLAAPTPRQAPAAAAAGGLPIPTTTAPAPTNTQATRTVGVQVVAPVSEVVARLHERFSAGEKSIQTLRTTAAKRHPKQANGTGKLCLSYHLRGICFDNCGSIGTHRKLVKSEEDALMAFLEAEL
jgi:hypothetical protein